MNREEIKECEEKFKEMKEKSFLEMVHRACMQEDRIEFLKEQVESLQYLYDESKEIHLLYKAWAEPLLEELKTRRCDH